MGTTSTFPIPERWTPALGVDEWLRQALESDGARLQEPGRMREATEDHRRLLGRAANELAAVILGTRREVSTASADTAR